MSSTWGSWRSVTGEDHTGEPGQVLRDVDHIHVQTRRNGCLTCGGTGRVIANGFKLEPVCLECPECAGLAITPASGDEYAV